MPRAVVGDIELEYETIGAPDDPAILLVMGLGPSSFIGMRTFVRDWPMVGSESSGSTTEMPGSQPN